MRAAPERVAWLVLLFSFAALCTVMVAVPLGVRWYVLNAEKEHDATVESLVGTVVVEPPVGRGPVPLSRGESMSVPEGTVIRVDETSEAVVEFFDHSFMRLFSGCTVRVERSRSPRYASSPLPNAVHLNLSGGRFRIGTAMSLNAPLEFEVETLHAVAILDADGDYAVEASNDRSEISAYRGHARVLAAGQKVDLGERERTEVAFGEPPEPAVGVARNLVVNGGFAEALSNGWRVFNEQGTDGGDVDGRVEVVVDEGRRAVKLSRTGGQGNHCETVLEQTMDRRLPDPVTSLIVRATVKLSYQSLSGGGYLSSEYPLMIRLSYRDVYDSDAEWIQGFYYQNMAGNPTTYGLQFPRDRWLLFESENLLESLPVTPFKIMRLRVYASGWDYESLVSDISLIVE